jgi:glycosyltransferase 2 family protein
MNKKRFLIGLSLAAIFLFLFLRNIDLVKVWAIIRTGNPYWLIFAIVMNLFNYFIRAVRWRYFLMNIKKTRLWNLFSTTVIGFALSTIFPARIGEVVRPYLLGMKENISRSSAFATVVVERLFDTLTVLLMLVFYLLLLIKPEELSPQARSSLSELKHAGLIIFGLVVAALILLYYLKTRPAAVKTIIARIEKFLPKRIAQSIDGVVHSFIQGLSILHDPAMLLKIAAWSIVFWLEIAIGFWAGMKAYLPDFAFTSTFLMMILLAIGIAVPTPGAVGSYHLACKIGLTHFFGVSETKAGAVALVSHFISFVPVTFLGVFFLWHEGLTAKKLNRITKEEGVSESVS